MTFATTLMKLAAKRDSTVPIGQPGPMHLDCPCGRQLPVDYPNGPDVTCTCGNEYTADGYVVKLMPTKKDGRYETVWLDDHTFITGKTLDELEEA